MCGRFAQSQTREDYLALLAEDIERDIPYDPEPIGRYNVAPGTKVLLLSYCADVDYRLGKTLLPPCGTADC
ncbi:hypothetical protein JV429_005530 [Escherichia coli]|nr:hypothetical protein [Escherichia coli]EHJ7983293.1 hypothetical protein [Escherichia coli]